MEPPPPSQEFDAEAPRPVPSGGRFGGPIRVPSSKSVTNRYLVLALLAERPLRLVRPLVAADTEALVAALGLLGVAAEAESDALTLTPGRRPQAARIDCGESGTMARFLLAALSALPGRWRLGGAPRLEERPVAPLAAALVELGASLAWLGRPGRLPVAIDGGTLAGGEARLDAGESSQYLSALLIAATRARRPVEVAVRALTSAPYVDLTLAAMRRFGHAVERRGDRFRVRPGDGRVAAELEVEGDWSAACYPAAAAALTGGRVRLLGLRRDSAQGDRRFLERLTEMGATVRWSAAGPELAGGPLRAIRTDLGDMPDQVPTLAALAPFAEGVTRIRGVAHLRLKESDRLAAMAIGLERAGATVRILDDGLEIPGVWAGRRPPEDPVTIDPHGDHRIAMSFAVAGLRRPGLSIARPGVVAKSYPDFWIDFARGVDR